MIGLTAILAATLASSWDENSRASEMQPLLDVVVEAAPPYGLTRCAALYLSVMEWAGFERLGEEAWAATEQSFRDFAQSAAMSAQIEAGGTLEENAANVVRQVRNIADLYLDRFESNYAVTGQAFGVDPVVNSDLSFCRDLSIQLWQ